MDGRKANQFKPGQSGNPKGRPKGALNKKTKLLKVIEGREDDIVEASLKLALDGDGHMLKFLMERVLPNKPRDAYLPELEINGNLKEKGEGIIDKALIGEITPEEAKCMMGCLEQQTKLVMSSELEEKVTMLENLVLGEDKLK